MGNSFATTIFRIGWTPLIGKHFGKIPWPLCVCTDVHTGEAVYYRLSDGGDRDIQWDAGIGIHAAGITHGTGGWI